MTTVDFKSMSSYLSIRKNLYLSHQSTLITFSLHLHFLSLTPKRNAIYVYILFILVLDIYNILGTNVFVNLAGSISYDLMLETQELLVESGEVIISKYNIN